jgi:hypothetical protein
MHLLLGECGGSARAAATEYALRFPARQHPDNNVIQRLHERIRRTGSVATTRPDAGRTRSTRTWDFEEQVLDAVQEDPRRSTRSIGLQLGVHHSSVHQVLVDDTQHAFHYTKVQQLKPGDYNQRLNFCNWLLEQHHADPTFVDRILFTDEALFQRAGVFNQHNEHYWQQENPHVMRINCFQSRWKVNVWAGIVGRHLVSDNVFRS